jgi:pimeloyl-ACP methyl ester carboxylesterase
MFGFSKNPMIKRFHNLDDNLPVWFIFGKNSWIKSIYGEKAARIRSENSATYVKVIENAGHHVYADRPDEFNEYINSLLDKID